MYHTQFRRYPACTGLPGEREVLPGRPAKINRPGVHSEANSRRRTSRFIFFPVAIAGCDSESPVYVPEPDCSQGNCSGRVSLSVLVVASISNHQER